MTDRRIRFNRCVSCFAILDSGKCPHCGYEPEAAQSPGRFLYPGTILKGRYMAGKVSGSTKTHITYLGWDLQEKKLVELVEYFPEELVTRDIRQGESVCCIPGKEKKLEEGRQDFFQRAKLYFQCMSRIQEISMDFFFRNHTCYYVHQPRKNQ